MKLVVVGREDYVRPAGDHLGLLAILAEQPKAVLQAVDLHVAVVWQQHR